MPLPSGSWPGDVLEAVAPSDSWCRANGESRLPSAVIHLPLAAADLPAARPLAAVVAR